MNKSSSFAPRGVLASAGYPITAVTVPFLKGTVTAVSEQLYAAYITIEADQYCPYGVFPVSSAVDCSAEGAMNRASFESVERYCLASISWHENKLIAAITDEYQLYHQLFSLAHPFLGNHLGANFLPIHNLSNLNEHRLINCGDVFAPYPIHSGHCSNIPSTNGVALGRNKQSATFSAVLELFERDNIMRFWYTYERFIVKPVSFVDLITHSKGAVQFLSNLGYEIRVFNISRNKNLYVFLAFALHKEAHYPFSACAAGTGVNGSAALTSALNELIQTILALATQSKQFLYWYNSKRPLNSLEHNMYFYASAQMASSPMKMVWDIWDYVKKMNGYEEVSNITLPDDINFFFNSLQLGELFTVDLVPQIFSNEVSCVRALGTQVWPLVISEEHGPFEIVNHPERIPYPHPFP